MGGSGCDCRAAPTLPEPRGPRGGPLAPASAPTASPCALQDTYKLPHRLIEKKRRDRINECIAQLKDLLPEHLKLTVSEKLAGSQPAPPPGGRAGVTRRLQAPRGTAEPRAGSQPGRLCLGVPLPRAGVSGWPHANE